MHETKIEKKNNQKCEAVEFNPSIYHTCTNTFSKKRSDCKTYVFCKKQWNCIATYFLQLRIEWFDNIAYVEIEIKLTFQSRGTGSVWSWTL